MHSAILQRTQTFIHTEAQEGGGIHAHKFTVTRHSTKHSMYMRHAQGSYAHTHMLTHTNALLIKLLSGTHTYRYKVDYDHPLGTGLFAVVLKGEEINTKVCVCVCS